MSALPLLPLLQSPRRLLSSRAPWVLVAISMLVACSRQEPAPEQERSVQTITIGADSHPASAVYAGDIRARREIALGFLVSGRVQARLVEVGDAIKVGDPLLRLDPSDHELNAKAAYSQWQSAKRQQQQAVLDLARFERLVDKRYLPRHDYEQARLNLETSNEALEAADANYRLAQNQARYSRLMSTCAGVITAIDVEVGQVVQAGQVLIRVAENGARELVVSVPESRVDELHRASGLEVTLWAKPGQTYPGKLRELAPDTDSVTRTYSARISVLTDDSDVRLGMTGKLLVQLPTDGSLRRVPLSALVSKSGGHSVWIRDSTDGRVHARSVSVVRVDRNGVLIRSGLKDGETVVTAGVHRLHESQRVRLASESRAAVTES
ncbi:efflux RND transporter periplasmic adaptor subunit [Ahniella affigens]|uniref:Efflux RND transporter periplasmic adaptor subunit n=1 Tax=Ahniella affigens TaxID=2021234 RepID=A0A2P1PQQ1_9GAMM|nr:efflux RND transporter periplasmic adaptor subunit [Ahniella affigens]AVP97176.1 efflux RND transporter periplasmic adaptor subunit [Ahniella affigens]